MDNSDKKSRYQLRPLISKHFQIPPPLTLKNILDLFLNQYHVLFPNSPQTQVIYASCLPRCRDLDRETPPPTSEFS